MSQTQLQRMKSAAENEKSKKISKVGEQRKSEGVRCMNRKGPSSTPLFDYNVDESLDSGGRNRLENKRLASESSFKRTVLLGDAPFEGNKEELVIGNAIEPQMKKKARRKCTQRITNPKRKKKIKVGKVTNSEKDSVHKEDFENTLNEAGEEAMQNYGDADDHILSHEERCNSREIGTESTTTHNLWTEKKHFCRGEPFVLLYNSSTQHNQTHSCKKPGSCDTCQKHFSRRYSCNICKQSFSRKYSLDRHKNRHTGEKIYTCDTCEKCFFRKDKLIRHKRLHTGEKPYSCVTCQKDFSRKDNFDCHKRTHTVFMRHT